MLFVKVFTVTDGIPTLRVLSYNFYQVAIALHSLLTYKCSDLGKKVIDDAVQEEDFPLPRDPAQLAFYVEVHQKQKISLRRIDPRGTL